MINTGQRLNIAADSIYLWSIANYVIDPEICSADSVYEALIDSIPGTPTHSRLSFFSSICVGSIDFSCELSACISQIAAQKCGPWIDFTRITQKSKNLLKIRYIPLEIFL